MKIKYSWLLLALGFVACDDDKFAVPVEEPIEIVSGEADFSRYVAIGNSLTAGFTDGALFVAAQNNSLPSLLSQKFAMAGGASTFTQPLTNDNIGGLLLGGNEIQPARFYFDAVIEKPVRLEDMPTNEITNVVAGPFNNMGVPGSKSFHLLANGYGNVAGVPLGKANPYFARMASSPNASIMEDAMAQDPTFFTLWIGNNDVLAYALSGGTGVNQAGNFDPATYGPNDITDPLVFSQVFDGLVTTLTSSGAKGVISNIPYITSIPHFTTVPYNYNPVPLDADKAAQLNEGYAPYNGGLLQEEALGLITEEERILRTIHFTAGQNAVVIIDEDLTDLTSVNPALVNMRQTNSEDLMVLPSASFIGTLVDDKPALINGLTVPLADQWVLVPSENKEIIQATNLFNSTIKAVANRAGLAFFDVNALMQDLADGGITSGDFVLTAQLVVGGAFSLDGVHPTTRGYALLTNEILKVIDKKYKSNFDEADALLDIGVYPVFYNKALK